MIQNILCGFASLRENQFEKPSEQPLKITPVVVASARLPSAMRPRRALDRAPGPTGARSGPATPQRHSTTDGLFHGVVNV
jgi:hypothetical protein